MNQQEDLFNMHTMSLMDMYQVNDQPQGDHTQHQSPPLLAFSHSFSPCNPFLHILPSIPSSLHNNQNCPFATLPSHNNQNCPFTMLPLNNNQNHVFIPTISHNTKHHPFNMPHSSTYPELPTGPPLYNTCTNPDTNPSFLQYFSNSCLTLPDFKDSSLPSSTYIPLLTGRVDWGAWSNTVSMAIMNMNLYGHIAKKYTPRYGYNPGSIPTFLPIIDENASTDDVVAWYNWWHHDGQVFHLLFSCLSATAFSQLSGAGATHHDCCMACELYMELVNLFGGTNFNTAAAIHKELSHLLCAPAKVNEYVTCW